MALTLLPEPPVSLRSARDWANYEPSLQATPLVQAYLHDTLRSWVENRKIVNPLILPWIRALSKGDLGFLEPHLAELEASIGGTNLSRLIGDLLRKTGPAVDIRKDVASLYGEIIAFRMLREMGAKAIDKITTRGDWRADGVVVSVKTILDIDHNYQQIEDSLEGNACIEESPTLRGVRHIRLRKGRGLDYDFMNKILRVVDEDLERILGFLTTGMGYPDWYHTEVEALRIPEVLPVSEKGRLSLKVARHSEKSILLVMKDIREGETPDSVGHGIQVSFEMREDESLGFSTSNDLNTWWGMPEVDRKKLGGQISDKVREIAEKNEGKDSSGFAAWINIGIHPSLQQGIADRPDEFRSFLAEYVGDPSFPVIVHAHGGFELHVPLLASFGPPMDFMT